MDPKSTTAGDDPQNNDAKADGTTVEDPKAATDNQPANTGDNLNPSKSTDGDAAGGDTKPTDDKKPDGDGSPASGFDEDIDQWIEKRGLPKPSDDSEKQKYQDLRNEQREYTREQQAKKDAEDLGKTVDDVKTDLKPADDENEEDDEYEKRLKAMEADRDYERTTRMQSEFYTSNKVSTDEHKVILDVIKEKVARPGTPDGKLKALDFWGSPEALPDLLDIAKARLAKEAGSSLVADEAARQERERIAQESNASSTSRNAKTTQTGDKTPDQARNDRLLDKWSK